MLYTLFLVIAILYNCRKFMKERASFFNSLVEAKTQSHREMILSHHFYVFTFECFLALIVAHLLSEKVVAIGLIGMAIVYVLLLGFSLIFFQYFVKFLERQTGLILRESFNQHLIKELRVNFALIMLPLVIYSAINWASQDGVMEEWGSFWFIGILANVLFVSVLTIICTVIVMLRLIPNREITEPEYLDLINKRLTQIGMPNMRVHWIEADLKNAFVVGLKLLSFSNQTMFIGRSLRTTLTPEEFDAVVAHELAHVANRHIHKRVIDLFKNFVSIILGSGFILMLTIGASLVFWGDDAPLHDGTTAYLSVGLVLGWMLFNYILLFDGIRAHEFEADAYAVINLGADYGALRSALEKLTSKDEMPEYLKAKVKRPAERNAVVQWYSKIFSTHPDVETRMSFLQKKIQNGLPFNYYVSSAQRLRNKFWKLFHWKVAAPVVSVFVGILSFTVMRIQSGQKMVEVIGHAPVEVILKDKSLVSNINMRPHIVGKSLMFYVVKRGDQKLINYFFENGAEKGRGLVYLSELKDFSLFQKYYVTYENEITQDEFYLILRKTAATNFTEGYRYLVNGKRFEGLAPEYKESISLLHQQGEHRRAPASVRK